MPKPQRAHNELLKQIGWKQIKKHVVFKRRNFKSGIETACSMHCEKPVASDYGRHQVIIEKMKH